MTEPRTDETIRADLAILDEPHTTGYTSRVQDARSRLASDVEPLLARAERAEAQVRAVEAEIAEWPVANDRIAAYYAERIEIGLLADRLWDRGQELANEREECAAAEARVSELVAERDQIREQRDQALTLLADAIPDPKGAIDPAQWHRRMDWLASWLSAGRS